MSENRNPVGEVLGLLQIVRGQQNGRPAAQAADDRPQFPPREHVQSERGLVEDKHLRPPDQRHRDAQPPLKPAGQLARPPVFDFLERQRFDLCTRRATGPGGAHAAETAHQFEVFPNRQVLRNRRLLRRKPHARAGGLASRRMSHHPDLARIGRDQPAQRANRRRLARAVHAQQRERLAFGDRQRQAIHRRPPAKAARQVQNLNCIHEVPSFPIL